MSTLSERRQSQAGARLLLEELRDEARTPGLPRDLRSRAGDALRHLTPPDDIVDLLTEISRYADATVGSRSSGSRPSSNERLSAESRRQASNERGRTVLALVALAVVALLVVVDVASRMWS